MSNPNILYTPMRLIDAYFWFIGKDILQEKKAQRRALKAKSGDTKNKKELI